MTKEPQDEVGMLAETCESAVRLDTFVVDSRRGGIPGRRFDMAMAPLLGIHIANPAERPTIRVRAGLPCASARGPFQTAKGALAWPHWLSPAADRHAADPHLARHGRLGEGASWPQPTDFSVACVTWRTGERSWFPSHVD